MSPSPKSPTAAFGEVLRELRTAAGLSQEALAHECGRHRTYISMLERGINRPSLDTVFLLADALGVRASDLVRKVEKRRRL